MLVLSKYNSRKEKIQSSHGSREHFVAVRVSHQIEAQKKMAAAVPMLDDVIKEYLVFRGFSNTLKSFESDLKADKDKSFRVSYFKEILPAAIQHNLSEI